MKPTAAEIVKGMSRSQSATTPPSMAKGTPVKHPERVEHAPVGGVEQPEDEQDRQGDDEVSRRAGPLQVLELPSEDDRVAGRERDLGHDPAARLGDERGRGRARGRCTGRRCAACPTPG
jgi:hypothetical protein